MHTYTKACCSILTGLLLIAATTTPVAANGLRNPPETAAGLALDGGKMMQIEDSSAMAVNPANLAELEAAEAMLGAAFIYSESEFKTLGGTAETDDPWKILPNAFAAWPIEKQNLVAGVALTTPYGQSTVYDKDTILRGAVPYFAELTVLNVNPTLAARVGDRWSVGAGADVFHSTFELRQVLPPAFGAPDGTMKFDGDGNGVGWNVGVRFDVNEKQRVGLTYRSPVDVEYDGDFEISGLPIPRSDFETEIDFPSIVVVGYGVDLTERLTVGADVEWVEFSRFDSLVLDAGANNPTIGGPIQVAQDWEDIWTYGVAASFKLSEAVTLRGGYKYMESPIPDRTLAPTLPDGDKHELTAGIGFREGAHRLDLAYAYAFIDDREVSPAENPMGAGEYEITSHILSVTYGLTF